MFVNDFNNSFHQENERGRGSNQQEQKRVFELTRHPTNGPKLCCCKINGLHLSARGRGCGVATKRHVKEEEEGGGP